MFSVVPALAQIFGLIQMQSKSNPSARRVFHITRLFLNRVMCSVTQTSPLGLLVICSFWSISVHFSPFGLLQSILSIQSTLVNRSFSGPFWSTTPLPSLRYNLVHSVLLLHQVHFGFVGPVHSVLLVHFSLLGPLR